MAAQENLDFSSLGLSKTPNEYVDAFVIDYFYEAKAMLEHEKEFIASNALKTTKVDYFRLTRFINTALKNFQSFDSAFLSGLLLKLQDDVFANIEFVQSLATKTKVIDIIFNDFIFSIKEYKLLLAAQEDSISRKGKYESDCNSIEERIKIIQSQLNTQAARDEYKRLKLQLGDASHNFALAREEADLCAAKMSIFKKTLQPLFYASFKKSRDFYVAELATCTNTKAYYLDRYLWYRAQKSKTISNFLQNSNIDGEYDMKTYIKYYLKNVNAEGAADRDWHHYLIKALEIL
jgi:hypothetical protein